MRRDDDSLNLPLFPAVERASSPDRTPAKRRPALHVAGLFAGVGGLELGFSRAGHKTDLLCEIEPGAAAVLRHRFPDTPIHDDVSTLKSLPKKTDMIVAGFPCQDLSQAGKTVGIEGSRSGLVGEVFRLVRKRRVPWLLLENVPFMLQLSRGRAMEVIVAALEDLGYRWAYRVVNTRAFGLPQRRERVLCVATLDGDPRDVLFADDAGVPEEAPNPLGRLACGFYWTEGVRGLGWAVDSVPTLKGGSTIGIPSPPAIAMPNGEIVTPDIRDAERMQGFEADWTLPALDVAKRGHRWKLVGNAVTVDVAAWLGERLRKPSRAGRDVEGSPMRRTGSWPRAAWNVGDGRFVANISSYPVRRACLPLREWLEYETSPLSAKATKGFLERTETATLRFPPGFIEMVRAHLRKMERMPAKPSSRRVADPALSV
jgi:DNA (cytosine-5)-methyltransferase 1